MKHALAQSHSLLNRIDVLGGGKAPSYWRRTLSRETHRLVMVLRTCGWVKAVAEVQPSFLEKPLFGACLAEITSRDIRQSDVSTTQPSQTPRHLKDPTFGSRKGNRETADGTRASESLRPRAQRPDISAASVVTEASQRSTHSAGTFHPRSQDDESGYAQRRSRSDKVSQLPTQADASLLKRLAGTAVDVSKQKQNSSNQLSSLPRNRSASLSPVSITSQQHKDWRSLVAYRAATTWLRHKPSGTAPVPTSPASFDDLVKEPTPALNVLPLLEGQWATPLYGQRIAPEILGRLAKHSGVNGVHAVSGTTRSKVDSPDNHNPSSASSQFSGQVPSTAKRASGNDELNPGAKPFQEIFRERDQRLLISETDRAFGSQANANTSERTSSSQNFAPPALTPSMPQLLPPAVPGAVVSSIAAHTSRQGALRDEVKAQDKDLSLLAAQMKRILDEEARRHGIDV